MSFLPKPQEIYRHFKGNLYQITAIAEHTETGETLVVYQALYGDFRTYARPLAMFTEELDRQRYPDAGQTFRFELQGPDAQRQLWESRATRQVQNARGKDVRPSEEQEVSRAKNPSALAGREALGAKGSSPALAGQKMHNAKGLSESGGHTEIREEATESIEAAEEEGITLDPLVLEFLDSDTYEQRLNILAALHHRITDDMITTMAIACDVEINEGDVEERYESLRTCLLTLDRYECNRLR